MVRICHQNPIQAAPSIGNAPSFFNSKHERRLQFAGPVFYYLFLKYVSAYWCIRSGGGSIGATETLTRSTAKTILHGMQNATKAMEVVCMILDEWIAVLSTVSVRICCAENKSDLFDVRLKLRKLLHDVFRRTIVSAMP